MLKTVTNGSLHFSETFKTEQPSEGRLSIRCIFVRGLVFTFHRVEIVTGKETATWGKPLCNSLVTVWPAPHPAGPGSPWEGTAASAFHRKRRARLSLIFLFSRKYLLQPLGQERWKAYAIFFHWQPTISQVTPVPGKPRATLTVTHICRRGTLSLLFPPNDS